MPAVWVGVGVSLCVLTSPQLALGQGTLRTCGRLSVRSDARGQRSHPDPVSRSVWLRLVRIPGVSFRMFLTTTDSRKRDLSHARRSNR